MHRKLWVGVAAALTLGTAGAIHAALLLRPADKHAEERVFTIEPGTPLSRVALGLETSGLVRDARATAWWARLNGLSAKVQAGEYGLSGSWSTPRILDWISQGRVKTYEIVLPEGIRASEIAARLHASGLAEADAFLAVVHDAEFARSLGLEADSLEGYLFPETYRLPRNLPPSQIARIMVDQFHEVWREIEAEAGQDSSTVHEIVTLASIVEKESRVAAERPLIAAVFLSRLRRGMRLETDPSVIYGIADFDGNLRKRDLLDDSNSYNSYRFAGLPPGPIASPGEEALRAVIKPAESDYLYFVSRNDGTHHFSRTYNEHVNAVNRFQKRRRSR